MKKYIFVFSLLIFGSFFFNISSAHAATLYYNDSTDTVVDGDWNTLSNWWTDAIFTAPALALPTVSDDVIITENLSANGGSTASVNTITATSTSDVAIDITVANGATFNDSSINDAMLSGNATFKDSSSNGGIISGDVVFNNSSTNSGGTVSGNATFKDSSINYGAVTGNATFNNSSYNDGTTSVDAVFNDSSYNRRVVSGNAIFNDLSFNSSTCGFHCTSRVLGNATFNNSSYNNGLIGVNAIFNDTTVNYLSIGGGATFNDSSSNSGTVSLDTTFNDLSHNDGLVAGITTFNNSSYNNGTLNNIDTVFNDLSYNSGTVSFNASFFDSSYNNSLVSGNATFNDSSYNSPIATVGVDAYFYDSSSNASSCSFFCQLATVTRNACFVSTATNNGTVGGNINTTLICTVSIPTVTTTSSTVQSTSSADLFGAITNTGGESATVGFQYYAQNSSDTTYSTTISTAGTFVRQAFDKVATSLSVCGLYHYRAFATNSAGTGYGGDLTFTATPCHTGGGGGSTTPPSVTPPVVPPVIPPVTVCPAGDKFNTTTGLPCTSFVPPVVPPACSVTHTLALGSNENEVKCLQIYLNTHGYSLASTGPGSLSNETNKFGRLTYEAVVKFQKAHNLVPDGIVGPLTRAAMNSNI